MRAGGCEVGRNNQVWGRVCPSPERGYDEAWARVCPLPRFLLGGGTWEEAGECEDGLQQPRMGEGVPSPLKGGHDEARGGCTSSPNRKADIYFGRGKHSSEGCKGMHWFIFAVKPIRDRSRARLEGKKTVITDGGFE
jgi:hypothetical protein